MGPSPPPIRSKSIRCIALPASRFCSACFGIEGTCLLNTGMVPGGLVKIDQRSIQRGAISPAYGASASNGLLQQVSIAIDGLYKLFLVEHRATRAATSSTPASSG